MSLIAEACMLQAIQTRLRTELGLTDKNCAVEFDNEVPAIAGEVYYAIVPAGLTPGPRHMTSGGVFDFRIAVRVVLYLRHTIARDRRSDILMDTTSAIADRLDAVMELIHFDQTLRQAAEALLVNTSAEGGQFVECFKRADPDRALQPVVRDEYAAAQMQSQMGDPILAYRRGITFGEARFMKEL
jgi:hypothetical protein